MRLDILSEYEQHHAALARLGAGMEAHLHGLLAPRGIKLHALRHRIKDRDSLQRKLARPDRTYQRLWDVTDLVGLRVITYFEDEVAAVAQLIEAHCDVDWTHSSDKRSVLGEGRFGYRSVHYVCGFARDLGVHDVDSVPREARCEIQLRTVLQHAWAEIEHDLGYKSLARLPPQQRRRFNQLAALQRCELTTVQAVLQQLAGGAGRVLPLLGPYFGFARSELGLAIEGLPQVERGYGLYFLALAAVTHGDAPRLHKVERFAHLFEELDRVDQRQAQRLAGRLCDALTRERLV